MSSVRVSLPLWTRDELIDRLRVAVSRVADQLPLERAVLFGSWARGAATAASDVDLLLVYSGAARPDAFGVAWHALGVPRVEIHVFHRSEADAMAPTIDRMTQNSVDLLASQSDRAAMGPG